MQTVAPRKKLFFYIVPNHNRVITSGQYKEQISPWACTWWYWQGKTSSRTRLMVDSLLPPLIEREGGLWRESGDVDRCSSGCCSPPCWTISTPSSLCQAEPFKVQVNWSQMEDFWSCCLKTGKLLSVFRYFWFIVHCTNRVVCRGTCDVVVKDKVP